MSRLHSRLSSRKAQVALALIVLNEIRGVCVVAGVLLTAHGRIF